MLLLQEKLVVSVSGDSFGAKNNIRLSIKLKEWCDKNLKRFIYASSAATYGDGDNGFLDNSRFEMLECQTIWSNYIISIISKKKILSPLKILKSSYECKRRIVN